MNTRRPVSRAGIKVVQPPKAKESARSERPATRGRRLRRIVKTSELIARDLILDIAQNGLVEGDALEPEARMLEHYQVGRASLREALRLLEVNQLVTIRPGARGGPVVGKASPEGLGRMMSLYFGLAGATYEDLTDVMLALNPVIVRKLARTRLNARDKARLLASAAESENHETNVETESLAGFHTLLGELSGNPVWALTTNAIGALFRSHVISTADSSAFHETAGDDHRVIAEAILAGDEDAAADHMLAHTRRFIAFYRRQNPGIFVRLIEWR